MGHRGWRGRPMLMAFELPLLVVPGPEGEGWLAQLFDRRQGAHREELRIHRVGERLGTAVAFEGSDERRTRCDPQEPEVGLEVGAHVLTAMVVPDAERLGEPGSVHAEHARTLWRTGSSASNRLPGFAA